MIEYKFYTETYMGCSISEADWTMIEARAAAQLAQYKRTYTVTALGADSEALAVCAMADVVAAIAAAQSGAGAVTSASIGSVSVSYGNVASIDLSRKGQARELYDAARQFLDIYRG